jgi:hypothetical protein
MRPLHVLGKEGRNVHAGKRILTFALTLCLLACSAARAADDGRVTDEPQPLVVLDTTGFWRLHHTLRPPVVDLEGVTKPIMMKQRWLNAATSPPATDWMRADFDDSGWFRGPILRACRTPFLARLCVRGRFAVTDPAKVGRLTLSADFRGGIVVYVNGAELVRDHMPGEWLRS